MPTQLSPRLTPRHALWLSSLSLVLLSACGGGSDSPTTAKEAADNKTQSAESPEGGTQLQEPIAQATLEQQKEGGRLNSEELQKIEKTGVLPKAFEGPSLSGDSADQRFDNPVAKGAALAGATPKYATTLASAHRFYNTRTGAHFYTTSEAERDNVRNTLPFMSYEGPAFKTSRSAVPGLSPVHRFYNTRTGVHFYTISEDERAHVVANLPQFTYEGVAYHASTLPGTGYTPLYRFFLGTKGFHFYTNSETERDRIRATLPQYSYEGVGYYVLGDDWQTPAVPHTGVTSNQCFIENSISALEACNSAGAQALSRQQDGQRAALNAMSYSPVEGQSASDCLRDNVTGLVWEVKTASGVRAGSLGYSNIGDGSASDASTFVNTVNSSRLCGFNDWRLPTVEELHGLRNYGITSGAAINPGAFPNTRDGGYWTNTKLAADPLRGWKVSFRLDTEISPVVELAAGGYVRLVRGAPWAGARYLITSVTNANYREDAGNAVIDRKTGLTWRRCLEGQAWRRGTCENTPLQSFHQLSFKDNALRPSIWRLPNIKELQSLADYSRSNPAQDVVAFPESGTSGPLWSSTPAPSVNFGFYGYMFNSRTAEGLHQDRLSSVNVRLVLVGD